VVGSKLTWIEGSHLFPMEKPHETAQAVLTALGKIAGTGLASETPQEKRQVRGEPDGRPTISR
jgi:hypothetical protein